MEDEKQKYLEEDQLISLKTIQLLAKAGYTLEEIKDILQGKQVEEQLLMQRDLLNIQLTNTKTMLTLLDWLQNHREQSTDDIYHQYLTIQNRENMGLQFDLPDGLQMRIQFHHQHTHFKDNFHEWMFSHYQFHPGDQVLEIGCGDGTLWECQKGKLPKDIHVILSDISNQMLETAREKTRDNDCIKKIEYADCFDLPYDDGSFDVVIINHVLMYFENVNDALKEIHRVLKKKGTLYCSTIAKDMMKERDALLKGFDQRISFDQETMYQRFGYENGKEKLAHYFGQIKLFDRKEVYEVKDMDSLYAFIMSGQGLSTNLEPLYHRKEAFYTYLQYYYQKHSVFYLTTHAGMFQATKEE